MTAPRMENPKQRRARFDAANASMEKWRGRLSEIYKYFFPFSDNFYTQTEGQSRTNPIWDTTGMIAASNFSNFMQNSLMPSGKRWVELSAGSAFTSNEMFSPSEIEEINERLQKDTDILFKYLNDSNFELAVAQSFRDLVVGTGVILVNEGTLNKPLNFTSVPISNLTVSNNGEDYIENYWRKWELKPTQIMERWPLAKLPSKYDKNENVAHQQKLIVIEGCIHYPNNPLENRYLYYLQLDDGSVDIYQTWYEYCPFVGFRYEKISGETLGRGNAELALPFVKILNKISEYEIKSAKFKVFPAFIDLTGRSFNPHTMKLLPGSVTPIRWDGSGVPIQPIPSGGDLKFTQLTTQNLRLMIHELLYSPPLGNVQDTPTKTATEISIRQQNFLERSTSAVTRLTRECIYPLIDRCINILRRKGIIKDIQTSRGVFRFSLDEKSVNIEYKSPILSLQNNEDIKKVVQWVQVMMQIEGLKDIGMMMETTKIPLWLAEKLDIDLALIKNQEAVQQSIQQMANSTNTISQQGGVDMKNTLAMLAQGGQNA